MIETIIREYGMPWLFNRSLYAAKLKMLSIFPASERLFEKKTGTVKRLDIFDIDLDKIRNTLEKLSEDEKRKLIDKADKACKGIIRGFSSIELDYGAPVNWQLNPLTGVSCAKDRKWYRIPDFDQERGDIKAIWEISRFSHLILMSRVFLLTDDTRYYKAFSNQVQSWAKENMYSYGANYKCGQECSLRMVNILLAYHVFNKCGYTTEADKQAVCCIVNDSYRKVLSNFFYAYKCIKNNHTISECMGMIVGAWCHNDTNRIKKAYEYLEKAVEDQFTDDGGYTQYSFNYQRLALQDMNLILSISDKTGISLSNRSIMKLSASAKLMYQCSTENGDMPNYGANDGALIYPFTSCRYRDFRPVIQTTLALADGVRVYDDAVVDEELIWHGVDERRLRDIVIKKESYAFEEAGIFTLRQGKIFVMFIANKYKKRPAHMDQLHVDVWVDNMNVYCDSGTYSYASKLGQSLSRTKGHNTVRINDKEQMNYKPPFLIYNWTQRMLVNVFGNGIRAEIRSKNGYKHTREIELKDNRLSISDKVQTIKSGECEYQVMWHTPCDITMIDFSKEIHLEQDGLHVKMKVDGDVTIEKSTRSTHYLQLEEIKCVCVNNGKKTIIEFTDIGDEEND